MWKRAWMSLIAGGCAVVLAASPAGAKFFGFELEVDRSELAAGDVLHIKATVYALDDVANNPEMVPPVEVYRTDDLPASGAMSESAKLVETVQFTNIGDGRFRGQVVLSEPGSYEIVSMGMWNRVQGYPEPISLSVTNARTAEATIPNESGVSLGWGAAAAGAAAALVGVAVIRRRSNVNTV